MILIDWRIGTPEATVPENVRDQRARDTFLTMSPMWKGMRSLIRSHWTRPRSVLFHWMKPKIPPTVSGTQMNQAPVIAFEIAIVNWVIIGSSADSFGFSEASSSKIPAKIGTMKATTAIVTTIASPRTKLGYIIAERI